MHLEAQRPPQEGGERRWLSKLPDALCHPGLDPPVASCRPACSQSLLIALDHHHRQCLLWFPDIGETGLSARLCLWVYPSQPQPQAAEQSAISLTYCFVSSRSRYKLSCACLCFKIRERLQVACWSFARHKKTCTFSCRNRGLLLSAK